jgi:hypothetical protein
MPKKTKMKRSGDYRTNTVTVRYSDSERAAIIAAARAAALDVASWIRMVSVATARVARR